jgi:hypothetical protein
MPETAPLWIPIANKKRICYFCLACESAPAASRSKDMDGVSHTVEVTAATPYEAVAQGLAAIRGNEWVVGIAQGLNVVKVSVADARVFELDRVVSIYESVEKVRKGKRMDHSRMKKLLNWFGDSPLDFVTPQEIERRFQDTRSTADTTMLSAAKLRPCAQAFFIGSSSYRLGRFCAVA